LACAWRAGCGMLYLAKHRSSTSTDVHRCRWRLSLGRSRAGVASSCLGAFAIWGIMTAVAAARCASHSSISRASGEIVKGSIPNLTSTPTTIGYVGLVHPGQAQAVQNALGSALLAQVTDSASGTVVIARSANGIPAAAQSTYFSQWKPVLSQSQQASLQSWDMLLSDRPTAQPIIDAAIAAVAQEGYVSSAGTLQSELEEVLISDNPVVPDSVIVTLLVPGAVVPNPPGASGPVVHSLDAYTVIMQQSTGQPTGVARGGLLSAPGPWFLTGVSVVAPGSSVTSRVR
jgi:hypothetical protein